MTIDVTDELEKGLAKQADITRRLLAVLPPGSDGELTFEGAHWDLTLTFPGRRPCFVEIKTSRWWHQGRPFYKSHAVKLDRIARAAHDAEANACLVVENLEKYLWRWSFDLKKLNATDIDPHWGRNDRGADEGAAAYVIPTADFRSVKER